MPTMMHQTPPYGAVLVPEALMWLWAGAGGRSRLLCAPLALTGLLAAVVVAYCPPLTRRQGV